MYMIFSMMMLMSLSMIIPMFIYYLNKFLSMKIKKNREKSMPFECGYDQMTHPHLPFSIQFFLITLMFLIFDVEIIMILPIMKMLENMNTLSIYTFILFILILLFSLWYEWSLGYLTWNIM